MGFYNIYTEGQQAEEYKARKAKEAEEKEKAEAERRERRYNDKESMKSSFYFYDQPGTQARHYSAADGISVKYGQKKIEDLEQDRKANLYYTPDLAKNEEDKKRRDATNSVVKRDQDRMHSEIDKKSDAYHDALNRSTDASKKVSDAYHAYRGHGMLRNITKSGKASKAELDKACEEEKAAEKGVHTAYDAYSKAVDVANSYAGDNADAVNRHMRRHPDQWDGDKRIKTRSESGIFESVEFLNN